MEDDWDLQAVVRGYCTNSNSSSSSNCSNSSRSCSTITTMNTTSLATSMENPFSLFAPVDLQQQQQEQRQNGNLTNFASLPDLFEQRTGIVEEELEQLYKPFFTKFEPSTTTISLHLHSSVNDPVTSCASIPPPLPVQQKQQQKQQIQSHRSSNLAVSGSASNASTPRPKRRKNQQKRVVCQVPAEGLSSDMWAWRKYGQKPIKGSPYPRGYYRCSSSKGCLARKQVERSRSDPGMFVITYTAEHNHPVPTHRNSLAGSTRNKISTTTTSSTTTTQRLTTGDSDPATTTTNSSSRPDCSPSSPASTTGLSPTTPLASSMDDELVQQSKPQESEEEEEAEAGGMELDEEDDGDGEVLIPEGLLTDDLFNGLEELAGPTIGAATSPTLDDCFADHFPTGFPASWFNNSHNAAAAAGGS